jgi:Spy/CpxP family protein refolding chaperone
MKSICFLASAITGTTLLWTQMVTPLPPVPARDTNLMQYLGLSDTQRQTLQDVQASRAAADQVIYKQISDKQTAINNLIAAGSNDALQIGQVNLEINNLRKQLLTSSAPLRESALTMLTQDQKNKLPGLTNALPLQSAAHQAIGLNLVDQLNRPTPLPLTITAIPQETALGAPIFSAQQR